MGEQVGVGPTIWITIGPVKMTLGVAMIIVGGIGSLACWLWG